MSDIELENELLFAQVIERMGHHATDSQIQASQAQFLPMWEPDRRLTPPEFHEFMFNVLTKIKMPYDRHMYNLKKLLDSVMLYAQIYTDARLREALGEDIIRDISGTFIAAYKLISPLLNHPIQPPPTIKLRQDFQEFGRVVGMITDALAVFYGYEEDSSQIREIAHTFQEVNKLPELPKPSGRKPSKGQTAVSPLTGYVANRAIDLYKTGEFNNYTEVARRMIREIQNKPAGERSDVEKKFLRDMTGKKMKKGDYDKQGDYLTQCIRRFKTSQNIS